MVIMTIAGFDPSAGAGTLADIKTMSAFGCYGVAAITSLTYQNTQGVYGAAHQAADVVRQQLDALFDDFRIAAIKTGMLPTGEVIREVAEAISTRAIPYVIVDPVIRSTSGFDLIDDVALQILIEKLFPLASVVTPNAREAERISGIAVKDAHSMAHAAAKILTMGAKAVLIKGGDLVSEDAIDFLADADGSFVYTIKKIQSSNTHGTGCTLSSALACLLALGYSLREALPIAKKYIAEAIRTAPNIGQGFGPLNHFPPEFGME
jgi:hydroxymethylpyrimidine kinase/phosphomethylpyrimidine kinase